MSIQPRMFPSSFTAAMQAPSLHPPPAAGFDGVLALCAGSIAPLSKAGRLPPLLPPPAKGTNPPYPITTGYTYGILV
jgi:hypothetical protein